MLIEFSCSAMKLLAFGGGLAYIIYLVCLFLFLFIFLEATKLFIVNEEIKQENRLADRLTKF